MSENLVRAVSRRLFVTRSTLLAGGALTLLGSSASAQSYNDHHFSFDVACDGRTFVTTYYDGGGDRELPTRGDSFIVNGKIYPAGTLEMGLSGPDQPGSIGTWVCRGMFFVNNIMTETPHVITTQLYQFDDGNGLVSEGYEGGMKVRRAVIGGIGMWGDAFGDVVEEEVEENDTLITFGSIEVPAPNIRFTFSLTSRRNHC